MDGSQSAGFPAGVERREPAKFWMQVLTDLKTRGVQDILICCVEGLKGFPDAIQTDGYRFTSPGATVTLTIKAAYTLNGKPLL